MEGDTRDLKPLDVVVFSSMLGVSALIGVYQAYKARKSKEAVKEYLSGGQNMAIFPISMSLVASFISGIALLGLPSEMYIYGTQLAAGSLISNILISVTVVIVYLPVFYGLQITSSYEYLDMRFNHAVRLMGSAIFLIDMILYIPIVIYVPALAFNQVTGINLHMIAYVVCAVCIFYTTLGGLKAVVWTDTVQTIVMFGGAIAIAAVGTHNVGGFSEVWKRNLDSGRIEFFNFDLDPTIRHTFWGVVIGSYFNWLSVNAVNQAMVQRYLAMPSLRSANISILLMTVSLIFIVFLCYYTGIVVFATYYRCDPVTTQRIKKPDNILPYFVMELSENIPGLPGLFLSGVFSAALSTMSTGLNSMAGVIYEDIIKPGLSRPMSQNGASRIMKVIVVIAGTICVAMVVLVEQLSGLIQAGRSLSGITSGALLGIFSLGMFFPSANSKGALTGSIVSLLLVAWISCGTQYTAALGIITYPRKPLSTEGCVGNFTVSNQTVISTGEEPFFMYKLSYMWYPVVGFFITMVLGLIVSWMTGGNQYKNVDRKLYSPIVRGFLRETEKYKNEKEMATTRSNEMTIIKSKKNYS